MSAIPWIGNDFVEFLWGGFSVTPAPHNEDVMSQILLFAGTSSIFGVGYVFNNKNVKKSTTRRLSAVVRNYSNSNNFEAIQRLNAGDLIFPYIVGLIEGDGWFTLTKNNKYIKYEFGIELDIRDIQLLYKLKSILGVGTIDIRNKKNNTTCIFRIRDKSYLKYIILPIFDKYPMLSNKQYDYLNFKDCLLSDRIYHEELLIYTRPTEPLNSIETILNQSYFQSWLIGFIEAEGSFNVYKPNKENSLVASFDLAQTNESITIEAIRKHLSFTSKVNIDNKNCYKLKVSSVRAIENIIKFMDKAPIKLMGHKKIQYILWLKELRNIPRYSNKINIPDQY
jgi:hypothetical protein